MNGKDIVLLSLMVEVKALRSCVEGRFPQTKEGLSEARRKALKSERLVSVAVELLGFDRALIESVLPEAAEKFG